MQASATGAPGPLYAELELKKAKQKVSLPDMTDVQYSEIKTDEVKDTTTAAQTTKSYCLSFCMLSINTLFVS